jgi:DNA polymerase-3 subunit alpha
VADSAIQAGQRAQEDKRAGQFTLFGGSAGGSQDGAANQSPLANEEWSEAEMLAREKAVLGFYATHHPLANLSEMIEACATASTVDLAAFLDNTGVIIGGLVTGLRQVALRNGRRQGEKMEILTVEDLKGQVEVTLAPKELDEYRSLAKPDAVVFVKGTVNRRREEPSVRATEVFTVEQAPAALSTGIVLRLDEACDDEETLERLFEICTRHRGPRPVHFEVRTTEDVIVVIKCAAAMSVDCSAACLGALAEAVGTERVLCIGPTRRPIPWALVAPPSSAAASSPAPQAAAV